MNSKIASVLFVVVGLILTAIGLSIEREDWVVAANGWAGDANRSLNIRSKILTLKRGDVLDLSTFRLKNGHKTAIALIEGTFEPDGISPQPNWLAKYWKNALLVNSVDEQESSDAGISGVILSGCGIKSNQSTLARGETHLYDCSDSAAYRRLGIQRIANVAIVTWQKVGESEPCISRTYSGDRDKTDCVESSVRTGLVNIVAMLRSLPVGSRPDALILPALGTGIGGLPKSRFYQTLGDVILDELNKDGGYLPDRIFLQEWAGSTNGLLNAAFAIGAMTSRLEDKWTSQHPRGTATTYFVTSGSCFGLAILIAIRGRRLRNVQLLRRNSTVDVKFSLGWALAASALGAGAQKFFADLTPKLPFLTNPILLLALGFFSAFSCGYLLKASDIFKKSLAVPQDESNV